MGAEATRVKLAATLSCGSAFVIRKHFASASACPMYQVAIETAKTDSAEWHEHKCMIQEARIAIEPEKDVESVIDEAASIAKEIDSPVGIDLATMELTTDKEEDTEYHIDGTISEHWADIRVDSA